MPIRHSGGDFGELHVKMIVSFPAELNQKQKDLIEKIFPGDSSKGKSIETNKGDEKEEL